MGFCSCGAGGSNTGVTSKQLVPSVTLRQIFVPKFKKDGSLNSILETDLVNGVLPSAFITAQLDAANAEERWYPTPGVYKNVAPSKGDPISQSFNDNSTIILQKGIKRFDALLIKLEPVFISRLNNLACEPLTVYDITQCGNLEGVLSADGLQLFGKPVDKDTFLAEYVDATDTEVGNIPVGYEYGKTYNDADRAMLLAAEIEDDLTDSSFQGLKDIIPTFDTIVATGWNMTAEHIFGEAFNKIRVTGLTDTDFTLVDSGGSPVTITSVTEDVTEDGLYVFLITSTPAETLTLSFSKTGLSMEDQTIVTP